MCSKKVSVFFDGDLNWPSFFFHYIKISHKEIKIAVGIMKSVRALDGMYKQTNFSRKELGLAMKHSEEHWAVAFLISASLNISSHLKDIEPDQDGTVPLKYSKPSKIQV